MKKVIGFHKPEEKHGYLSNWYLSDFVVGGICFTSMEQYMMYAKAKLFKDDKAAEQILNTNDVKKIKALGRGVENYNDAIWNGLRQIVVYEGLLAKFSQNEELSRQLLATQDALLAECAVRDKIWGIGCGMQDDKRLNIDTWEGQNLLGFALMKVREQLKRG